MIKTLPLKSLPIVFFLIALTTTFGHAQQVVFDDDFSTTQSTTYTTSGNIGSSIWSVARSGQDFGARISGGLLTLTNDATSASNLTGWVSATTSTSNFDDTYNPILSQNAGIVSWTFNMRQIRSNPRGFEFGQFGVAFILAGTPGSNVTTGKGWALVLGNSGTTDAIRLVAYSNGLKTFSTKLSSKAAGYTDFGKQYTSARVEYNPADNRWTLYLRKDGNTFQNPKSGTLVFQETWIHSDYVNEPLTIMGGYWSAATTKNQTAFFDNISVSVQKPEVISIDPDSKIAGSAAFTMTVNGSGFLPTSKVQWNGQDRPTTYVSATQIKAAIPASDLVLSGTANVQVKNSATVSNVVIFDIEPSGAPTLTLSKNSLPTFNNIQGSASTKDTYTISGINLQSGATLTAPSQFEMSVGSSTSYSNPLVLPNTGGGLTGQPLTINVRVKATASAGVYSGTISNSATGAVTKLVAVSAKVLALEPTTAATAVNFSNVTSTSMTVNWTNGNGTERIVLIKEASAVNALPVDGINYIANATYGVGNEIGTSNFVIYKGSGSSVTVNGLNPATNYYVSVVEFNGPANAENYRDAGATASQLTLNSPAGLQIKVANTSYKINFDSTVDGVNLGEFQGTGIAKIAELGQLDSDSWAFTGFANGNIAFGGESPEDSSYENGVSDGDVDETGIYAFNVSETAENYTLGIKPGAADFNPGTITLRLHNRTSAAITSLNIGYKVYIKNVENSSTKVAFSHKLESVTSFSGDVAIVDVVSQAAADLNPSWKAYYRVVTLTGLNIPADKYYNLRWSGSLVSGTGAQDEFGIDDIEVVAGTTATPIANFVAFDGIAEDFVLQGNANLSADLSVQNRLVFNGGKLAIKDKTFTIGGTVTNTSSLGLIGGLTSNLVITGNKNPTLNFDTATNSNVLLSLSLLGTQTNTTSLASSIIVNSLLRTDALQTLNLGTNTLTGTLTSILNNGTILSQNTSATPFAASKTWGGTGWLQLNATAAQTLVAGTYTNLRLSSTLGTTATSNITVNGTLNLPAANPTAIKGSLSMGTNTLLMGANSTNTGVGEVTGIISRSTFLPNTLYTFGHEHSSILFPAAGTLPSSMSLKVTIGSAPSWKPGGILRNYDLIQTGGANTKAIIRQHYLDNELNGNTETKLVNWAHQVPSTTFEQGRSNFNSVENWVEITNANVGQYFQSTFDKVYITLDDTEASYLTWNGSVSNSWTTSANWTPLGTPAFSTKVLIPNVSTLPNTPMLNPVTEVGSILIEAGGIINSPAGAQLQVFDGGGAWINNGVFNPSTSTVIFKNLEATIAGSTNFHDLTIDSGGGLRALDGNVMRVSGVLLNNGSLSTGLNPNTVEFSGTGQQVILPNGGTLNAYYNLKLSGTATTFPTSLNIRGDLQIDSVVSFGTTIVKMMGDVAQTISGNGTITFNDLTIAKPTNNVLLAKDTKINGILNLQSGSLLLGSNNLTLGSSAVTGTFSPTTMIVTNGSGVVSRPFAAVGQYFYPIGELTGVANYSPITVNVTSGSFSNALVSVSVVDAVHPSNFSAINNTSRYWNVSQTGITNAVASISANYVAEDITTPAQEMTAGQLVGAFNQITNPWIKFSTLSNNTLLVEGALLPSGQNSVFTGIKAGNLSVEVYGHGSFCVGSTASLNAEIMGGDAPFTYIWSNGLPNSDTVSLPTQTVGTTNYTLTIRDANGFTASDNTNTVTILAPTIAGTLTSQQICASSIPSNIQINGNNGTVVYWQRSVNSDFSDFTNISNFTNTLTGTEIGALTQTTYFRALVSNGSCEEILTNTAVVEIKSTTWNGTSWSDGLPTAATSVIFSGNFIGTSNISACSIVVTDNAVVTIPSGLNVTSNGAVTVLSGSLTFENNANLIQIRDVQNTGNVTVKRNSAAIKRLDYTLWSSPVVQQNLLSFSPLTLPNRFYDYNSNNNQYFAIADPASATFEVGKSNLIRTSNSHPTTATNWQGVFTGVPNNGLVTLVMANFGEGKRFNMIGNPYPSPINAVSFANDNQTAITGTLYFWRKTNNAASPSYSTWTTAGFVGNGEAQVFDLQNVIRTGQGFFVEANGSNNNVIFRNTQRVANNADQFLRNTSDERNRIWLNVTNASGAFSQMLVGYMQDATNGVDYGIDGKYFNDGALSLTMPLDGNQYSIQGRTLPFITSDVVPLTLKTSAAGSYTIAIDHVDGLFSGSQEVYLRDNIVGVTHNLKLAPYDFATEIGLFDARFEIVYANSTLSTQIPNFTSNSVIIYKNDGNIVINAGTTLLDHVEVFDIRGRLLASAKNVNATETALKVTEVNQVLIVKCTSIDKATVTKKIIN